MSKADKIYKKNAVNILSGYKTENTRAKWEDGSPAYTIKQFGVCDTYDLREEFPVITLRPTNLKACMDEILWIYQKKSNNIHDLNSHIWDQWADETGSIGKAYGYQIKKEYIHHDSVKMNQIDAVIYTLKNDPFSRRNISTMYNLEDLHEMNLYPCAYECIWNVTKEDNEMVLNLNLIQRSNDFLVANNWNVCQYAILLMMLAQVCNMVPGRLCHMITDCHIYNRHIDLVNELLKREEYDAPTVKLNPDIKDFYDFTVDDLIIENYNHHDNFKIPVAI